MGIKKTQIVFHRADGGVVYRVGSPNSLISYFYCDYCKASSTTNKLSFDEVVQEKEELDSGETQTEFPVDSED